jgi:hypothetical protein
MTTVFASISGNNSAIKAIEASARTAQTRTIFAFFKKLWLSTLHVLLTY